VAELFRPYKSAALQVCWCIKQSMWMLAARKHRYVNALVNYMKPALHIFLRVFSLAPPRG